MTRWHQLQFSSPQKIRDCQNKRLFEFVNHYLYPFSPFYKQLFDRNAIRPRSIRTVEDLGQVPFTTKQDFVDPEKPDKFREFVLRPSVSTLKQSWPISKLVALQVEKLVYGEKHVREKLGREFRPVFMTFTSGTTQTPLAYLYSRYDLNNLNHAGERLIQVLDIAPHEYLVNLFPYAPHLAFWQVVLGGIAAGHFILSTGGGKVFGTQGNIKSILKIRPAVILGTPSYLYHVLREARAMGCRMDFVKKIVLGAARVEPGFKHKITELLAELGSREVYVLGTYGFTEARMAWAECPAGGNASSGYHTYPDKEIFEIIDPQTGKVKGEGEDGELVYTSINSRGSSVLRYRTGDFVKGGITYQPCPYCGRTVPVISSDITRISNIKDLQLTKIKGSLVNLNKLSSVLDGCAEIEEWQIEIGKKDDDPFEVDLLNIYITAKDSVPVQTFAEHVKKKFYLETEISPNKIEFIALADMVERLQLETAGKEKRIVDRRKVCNNNE